MCLRGDGMGPLDIQADLQRPAAIGARIVRAARLVHLGEAAAATCDSGQAELLGERIEIAGSRRVVVGINESDGGTSAGVRPVEMVRAVHLERAIAALIAAGGLAMRQLIRGVRTACGTAHRGNSSSFCRQDQHHGNCKDAVNVGGASEVSCGMYLLVLLTPLRLTSRAYFGC